MTYDNSNIFAKILRDSTPCQKILENKYALAFYDVYPQAPIHALIIPKGQYCHSADFLTQASDQEIIQFYRLIGQVIELLSLKDSGYRLISNMGQDAGQEVPHFHVHVVAGKALGPILQK